ncbi:MAG: hypothetical protein LBC02_05605 [Planctomycetaceae bacterium]|nr:hypothetical protein [Planctomycetaceae bacterium]
MLHILFNSAIRTKGTIGTLRTSCSCSQQSSVFHAKGSLIETKRETIWRKPSYQGEATLSPQWVGLDWRCVYSNRLIGLTGKK